MNIKVVYVHESKSEFGYEYPEANFRFQINNGRCEFFTLKAENEVILDGTKIHTNGKNNILSFCYIDPDNKNNNIGSNILRGFLFIIMIIILPFAFMSFKTNKVQPTKLSFKYRPDADLILYVSKQRYRCEYAQYNQSSEQIVVDEVSAETVEESN